MRFTIHRIEPKEWGANLSEMSHLLSFGEHRASELDRLDYALILTDELGEISAYVTVKEMDSETVYWQNGGSMPPHRGSIRVMRGYETFIKYARESYKRITTRIENTNIPMLKMALAMGFIVTGTWTFKGRIYLELLNEFSRE